MSDEKPHAVDLLFSPNELEAALAAWEEEKKAKRRTGEVCICGHSTKAHTTIKATGLVVCAPAKIQCLCKEIRPVLKGENLRYFMAITTGEGWSHALTKGIMRSSQRSAKVEWIVPVACDKCEGTDQVMPVPINRFQGGIAKESTGIDKLLCHRCRFDMFGES